MTRGLGCAALCLIAATTAAHSNPWTEEEGAGELLRTESVIREANGLQTATAARATSALYGEYGLRDEVTLVAEADMQRRIATGASSYVFDTAWTGARVALRQWDYSTLSGEILGGVSGVQQPGNAVSAIAIAPTAIARLMFGEGFTLLNRHAFYQIEGGFRWRSGAPANEALLDLGTGIEPWQTALVLLQAFSTASLGQASGAYRSYRLTKIEFSVAQRVTRRLWIQAGVLDTVLGTGAGEQGVVFAGWWRF